MKAVIPISILAVILGAGCATTTSNVSHWDAAPTDNATGAEYTYVNEGRYSIEDTSTIEKPAYQPGIILLSENELQFGSLSPDLSQPMAHTVVPLETVTFAKLYFPVDGEWADTLAGSRTLEITTDSARILVRIEDPRYRHDLEALYSRLLDRGVPHYGYDETKKPRKNYYWKRYVKKWRDRARMSVGVPPGEEVVQVMGVIGGGVVLGPLAYLAMLGGAQ